MSKRAKELKKHFDELCRLITHYDDCLEFESVIGVKCDVVPILVKMEKEISDINTLLEV